MKTKQTAIRLPDDIKLAAERKAKARRVSLAGYIKSLMLDDLGSMVQEAANELEQSGQKDFGKTTAPVKYPKRKRKRQADRPGARVETDREGRIRKIDQAFIDLCGFTIDEIRGKTPREFGLIRDDSDPAELTEIRNAMREVRPAVVKLVNYRKNGTRYLVRLDVKPIRNGFEAFETEVEE